jgi:enoyl-CoA hydratase/carnithine racemase
LKTNHSSFQFEILKNAISLELHPELGIVVLKFTESSTRNSITLEKSEVLAQLASRLHNPSSECSDYQKLFFSHPFCVLAIQSSVENVFISGGSLKEIPRFSETDSHRFTNNMRQFTEFLRTGALVSVSLLNGLAVGGGAEIALATDLRFSLSPETAISLAQAKWGVPAGWGMMQDLKAKAVYGSERRRGIAVAAQEVWTLPTLLAMGLIDADCSHEDKPDGLLRLTSLAENLANCPPELRADLIELRPTWPEGQLPHYDENLFSKYWMKDLHLKRLKGFHSTHSNSKRSH